MKTKYTLFRRGAVFYIQDSANGKQTSLRTKDETEAKSLLEARNAAQRQPVLNLHLARAYLTASDPAFVERTWQVVMEQMQSRGKESSRERYDSVFKSPSFDGIRNKKLMETTADDFFAVFKQNQVSINEFLKRLHNFAVHLGWIAIPIVAPYLWPKYEPKDRRGITLAEHQSVLAKEKKAEWKLYLELLWETGAAQSDAVNFKAEDIDWQSRTISYFRMKTGSLAQFTISKALEKVLNELPTTGVLFPNLSKFTANDRASRFRRRCHAAGVSGVTLHCYRYAWAERAKTVGMPERFAQAALGHNSKAIHRANASPHTIANYRDTFRLLIGFAHRQLKKPPTVLAMQDLDASFVCRFLDHLEKDRGVSARSRNVRLAAIHSFFHYVALQEPALGGLAQRVLAIKSKRHIKRPIDFLTRTEAEALLAAPNQQTWLGRRDHMLLLLALQTGLRLAEIIGLRCQDVALDSGPHVRCTGKGRKSRCVPLRKDTVTMLRAWLCERNAQPDTPLFPNLRGKPLSRDGVQYVLAKHLAAARQHCPSLKSKRVSPHVLRHSTAMELLQAGVDRSIISLWLGHERMDTTQIYLHASLELKEKALAKTEPFYGRPPRYRPPDQLMAFLQSL